MSLGSLPVEWIVSNVGKVLNNTNNLRKPVSSKEREKIKGDYPYYGATGKIDALNSYTHDGEYILMGEDGANLLSRVKDQAFVVKGKFWVNNHAHSLQASCGMPSNFFAYYLNQVDLQPFITGSAQPKLTRQNLDSIPMVVVPLAEQQEIVRQLDLMLAQVEQIKARLDVIPAILKKFRQSVLADAVSGKKFNSSYGRKTISSVATVVRGGSPRPSGHPDYFGGNIPWITVRELTKDESKYLIGTRDFLTELGKQNSRLIHRGTLLLTNSGATLGVPKISKIDGCINDGVVAILDVEEPLKTYLYYVLKSMTTDLRQLNQGAAQPNLNTTIVKNIEFNLPEDVNCLVNTNTYIESNFESIDKLEKTVHSAQKRVNLLTQSILAKAFRGELTAEWREQHQDLITGVNSAESLLAKIQAEREASKPVKKTRAKKDA